MYIDGGTCGPLIKPAAIMNLEKPAARCASIVSRFFSSLLQRAKKGMPDLL